MLPIGSCRECFSPPLLAVGKVHGGAYSIQRDDDQRSNRVDADHHRHPHQREQASGDRTPTRSRSPDTHAYS
ncbi:MAG: hypothetical protein WBZ37_18335, partial [Mycobacterium sp.]